MNDDERTDTARHELSTDEILGWIEFACWTMLALTPMLYYVNGPAVSTDQLVTRSILTVVSALGAAGLCFRRWRIRSKRRGDPHHPGEPQTPSNSPAPNGK